MQIKSSGRKKIHCSATCGSREAYKSTLQLASKKKSTQLLLQETASMKDNKLSDFHKNFCEALASANIPFSTLNNAKLKSFLELHFWRPIPDESSMLQLYQQIWKGVSPDTTESDSQKQTADLLIRPVDF